MKKKMILAGFFAGMMAISVPFCSYAEESALPEDPYSFAVQIGEHIYQFPMSYAEFMETDAWAVTTYYEESMEEKLPANAYSFYGFENDGNTVSIDIMNFDINANVPEECYVGGIDIDASYDFDCKKTTVTLPGEITVGKSSLDEIKAAYGEPSDTYEGDLYTKVTYEKDSYQEISLYVYKDENVLKQVEIRNFEKPEDFVNGEVSKEIPEMVTKYEAPKALTSNLTDSIVEYFGDLYRLPAPVSVFLANGWEIMDASDDAYVAGGSIAFIDLMKDNQKVHTAIYNDTDMATAYENCMIHELDYYEYEEGPIDMKLSGDVVLGDDVEDIIEEASEEGYYIDNRVADGSLTIAKNEDVKYKEYIEFWIDTEKDASVIAGMVCHNQTAAE